MSEQSVSARARAALARGALLEAWDILQRVADKEDATLDYLRVLTLARLGDTERALTLYEAYGLAQRHDLDDLTLHARLLKDQGFATSGELKQNLLARACKLYAQVYRRTRNPYPAVNAATLAWITGRKALAAQFARAALEGSGDQDEGGYFALATQAEARLILGDFKRAASALEAARAAPDADAGKRSTTVLQLERLEPTISNHAFLEQLLELIRPPSIASYCGEIFVADPEVERAIAERVDAILDAEGVGFAYGSLAAGGDILIAERLLARGAELHVVLPVAEDDFIVQSVASAGHGWLARYAHCRSRAASVTFSSTMSHVGGQGQFAYGATVAMGMARLRARHLHGRAVQIAIGEQGEETGAMTRSDVRAWGATGGRSIAIDVPYLKQPEKPAGPRSTDVSRGTYGLMFTDFPGFARLDERVLPIFQKEVMARAGGVLKDHKDAILYVNTWGDALYVVFDAALAAARTAIDLCDSLREIDAKALGLREGAAMRMALHFGPTYWGTDPVTGRTNYYGSEVARAARIEPVTPAGSVYVTEPFAAVLEMERQHPFVCDYVGQVDLPKGYGRFPLYHLRRRLPEQPAADEHAAASQDAPDFAEAL
jgi:class 3 adenylate cyclase